MVLATAMVNSPEVFQCLASASLTVVWASAGTASARMNSRFVFMIGLGNYQSYRRKGGEANGGEQVGSDRKGSGGGGACRPGSEGDSKTSDFRGRRLPTVTPLGMPDPGVLFSMSGKKYCLSSQRLKPR